MLTYIFRYYNTIDLAVRQAYTQFDPMLWVLTQNPTFTLMDYTLLSSIISLTSQTLMDYTQLSSIISLTSQTAWKGRGLAR